MHEPCPHCGETKRRTLRDRAPQFSRRTKVVTAAIAFLYFALWGTTQFVGTSQVTQSFIAQGSTVGNYAYSPMPFVVSVDETYFQPLGPQMQRADMQYGWFFGRMTELGATYISSPDDPHFSKS